MKRDDDTLDLQLGDIAAQAAYQRERLEGQHKLFLSAEQESVALFDDVVDAAGGSVRVAESLPVDTSDIDKMRKLDPRSKRAKRLPQLRTFLAVLKIDADSRARGLPRLHGYVGHEEAAFSADVLDALLLELAELPDLLNLLGPGLARRLPGHDQAAIRATLGRAQARALVRGKSRAAG